MKIQIPLFARDHFWEEPLAGSMEFWGFRWPVKCKVGDVIEFYFDKQLVATAIVAVIEEPNKSKCDGSGRFGNLWKVFWTQESFKKIVNRK